MGRRGRPSKADRELKEAAQKLNKTNPLETTVQDKAELKEHVELESYKEVSYLYHASIAGAVMNLFAIFTLLTESLMWKGVILAIGFGIAVLVWTRHTRKKQLVDSAAGLEMTKKYKNRLDEVLNIVPLAA